jgi:hypothetical protein
MDKTNLYNATHISLRSLDVKLDDYQKVCQERNKRKQRFK